MVFGIRRVMNISMRRIMGGRLRRKTGALCRRRRAGRDKGADAAAVLRFAAGTAANYARRNATSAATRPYAYPR